ncbi:MAG: tRNA pseudouridine(55) synthase TruB [Ruminococcus sp.]
MNGVLIINKPKEFTSFDVVAVVRKYSGQRKIGHTGTLDPNATGVLPLLLGNATKAQDIVPNHDKEYIADFQLGKTTDTLDIWGQILTETESNVSRVDLENILEKFTGDIFQIPPMYSAVQVNGKRLYDLARKGIEVEREKRKVTVYTLKLLSFDENSQSGKFQVACSKGTYIRTLIDDIGKSLGTGAVMTALERTSACGYRIEDCVSLDDVKSLSEKGELESKIAPTESLFTDYPYVKVSDAQAKRFYNGGELDCSRTYLAKINPADDTIFRVKDREDNFLGLGIVKGQQLKVYKHF